MAKSELVEGLRSALSRGHTLKQAMESFHNAGYKREEIEEAARLLHDHPSQPMSHPAKKIEEHKPPVQPQVIPEKSEVPKQAIQVKPKPEKPEAQKISKYEEKTKPKGKFKIILLIISIIVILGLIAAILIFQDELINLFR